MEFVWFVVDESDTGLGEGFEAHVASGDGPFVECSARSAPIRRMTDPRVGKMPTTLVRLLISLFNRSWGLLDQI